MNELKYILILFAIILTGCFTYPKKRINIVHDYIFENGQKICEPYRGLYYIVAKTRVTSKIEKSFNSYPCEEEIKIRCQDGSLHRFSTGVELCFISEKQLEETDKNIQYPK